MNQAGHEELVTIVFEAIPICDILPVKFKWVKVGLLDERQARIAVSLEESDIVYHFNGSGQHNKASSPMRRWGLTICSSSPCP